MPQIQIPDETIALLKKHRHFHIFGHIDPDGDCLGSQLGLAAFLERMDKQTVLYSPGPFNRPEIKEWEPRFHKSLGREELQDEALIVILDCSTIERIGPLAENLEGREILVIDHHSSGRPFGNHHCIFPSAPSVTFLIQLIIEAWGEIPTKEEAGYLLFGFCTDTGFFRHLGESSEPFFSAVGRLTSYGASPNAVFHKMYGGRELASRTHLGLCLSRAVPYFQGKVMLTWEDFSEKKSVGAHNRDSDTLYQLLQGSKGVEAVVFLRGEAPGEFSVGLRSNAWLEMGDLARTFGGGGHARAAGFSWKGTMQELHEQVLTALEKQLGESR